MTTRSGFMKSSIAAPSFRNSGLEQTANACCVSDRTAARTFSAVPTGTVDLVTTTLWPFRLRPISLATAEHVLQVGGAVLVRRRADGDEHDSRGARPPREVGGERRAGPPS